MTALKSARTLAASLGVLAFGALAATPAMAFDDVDWNWRNDVKQHTDIDVDIDIDLESTGLVQVEKLQIFLGNVNAESTVHDIDNVQYDRDQYFDSRFFNGTAAIPALYGGLEFIFCLCRGDNCDIDEAAFDATTQLPSVLSSATAVGNNQSITSDVPVFLHDGQYVADGWYNNYDEAFKMASLSGAMPAGYTIPVDNNNGNFHTDLAVVFGILSAAGILHAAEIEATSTVYNIQNATVDSTATAVANNLSVTLKSDVNGSTEAAGGAKLNTLPCIPYPGHTCGGHGDKDDALLSNHVVIADITQFAYANVSAVSNVCDVTLNEYSNLSPDVGADGELVTGKLGRPIVNSAATAVGNNVSITVGNLDPVAP